MKPALGESFGEVKELRDRLAHWLVDLGVLTLDDLEQKKERARYEWSPHWDVALSHCNEHGLSEGGCPESPCKVEAISLALMEVCHFYRDQTGPNAAVRDDLGRLAEALSENRLQSLEEIVEIMVRNHRNWSRIAAVRPLEESPWPACQDIVDAARVLSLIVNKTRDEVIASMDTNASRASTLSGRRARGRLIPAVCRYLRAVNVPWEEICHRVLGDAGRVDSLRKRCEGTDDSRSFVGHSFD